MSILVARVNNCPKRCRTGTQTRVLTRHPGLFIYKRDRVLHIVCSGRCSVLTIGPNTTNLCKFRPIHALVHFAVSSNRVGSVRIMRVPHEDSV